MQNRDSAINCNNKTNSRVNNKNNCGINNNVVNRTNFEKTKILTIMAILSAISYLLMFVEMPIPGIFPDFLKIDISDIPAILGGMSFSPFVGFGIVIVKNVVHAITVSSTGGVGEMANAIISGVYVFVLAYFFRRSKSIKGIILGVICGTIIMALVGAVVNYYIALPFYGRIYGSLDAIINLGSIINHKINNLYSFVIWMIIPFNIIKGILLSICGVVIFKKFKRLISK